MESGRSNGCSIRGAGPGGKKMRKRKELDALVGGSGGKRVGGSKRPGSGGVSPQDQLLSESTGEEDYWGSKPGGKGKRRYPGSGGKRGGGTCTALLKLCTILLIMACVVATITVMWLFIDIREQTTYLRSQLDQVAAGTQGVPEEIQQCHSLTRQLQNNQSQLFSQWSAISQKLMNFTNLITVVQVGLSNVQSKLHESPELINPKDLQALSKSVATYTTSMQDVQSSTFQLSENYKTLSSSVDKLILNLTELHIAVNDIKEFVHQNIGNISNSSNDAANEKIVSTVLERLKPSISVIEEDVAKKLNWTKDDQEKDHKELDSLQENSTNMSSHLISLKNDFNLHKANFDHLSQNVTEMKLQVAKNADDLKYILANINNITNSISNMEKDKVVMNNTVLSSQWNNDKVELTTVHEVDTTTRGGILSQPSLKP